VPNIAFKCYYFVEGKKNFKSAIREESRKKNIAKQLIRPNRILIIRLITVDKTKKNTNY